jgi:L-arabinose isomerase
MVGIELLVIDADTTMRQFRKEVRWSSAYWHLAGAV